MKKQFLLLYLVNLLKIFKSYYKFLNIKKQEYPSHMQWNVNLLCDNK